MNTAPDETGLSSDCHPPITTSNESQGHVPHRPEVPIEVCGVSGYALLDSGASVSAISEEFFANIKNRSLTSKLLSILPVTGVTISTAVRGRSKKITKQVFMPLVLFEKDAPGVFLVVPHLATPIILGDDWLSKYGVVLDYSEHGIKFPQWGKEYSFKGDDGTVPAAQITRLNVHYTTEHVVPTGLEHCLSSMDSLDRFSSPPRNLEINYIYNHVCPRDPLPTQLNELMSKGAEITVEQRQGLLCLLQEFTHIFSDRPGLNQLYTCRFTVSEDVPFKIRPYPVPFARRPAVEKELQRMLDWGVVERCSSPYSNPIICVGKADGSVRLCLDARRINKIILPMRDSSPPLDELLARFGGKSIFSSVDFTAGYWQVPLHQEVRKYTAFVYDGRTYQFTVVPFGLNISNTAFSHALEAVLNVSLPDCEDKMDDLHIYVDDLLVSSSSFDEHLQRLRILFRKIAASGMTLKLTKCEFVKQQIKFLGHIISPSGMSMDPEKLMAIRSFPKPRTKKELQSFIGFCNFYRKFADHHASLIAPLINLIKQGVPWKFGEEELKMFDRVKQSFTEQYLSHPLFDQVFYLQTDASILGLGAELFQLTSDGERRTILFASRTLNSAERNYSITELELLSVVFACEKFRVFILGYPVQVLTDHQALTFLFQCRLRNARLTRWTLLLQQFDLRITYIPGSKNILDALSRNPVGRNEEVSRSLSGPSILLTTPISVRKERDRQLPCFQAILSSQKDDPPLKKIMDILNEDSPEAWPQSQYYCLVEGVLFYRRHASSDQWLVCVPNHRIDELIVSVHHHFGHVGPKKTILAIRDFCFFKHFQTRVRSVVRACDLCQRTKASTQRQEGELKSVLADVPLGRVLVDLYGPLPQGWNNVRYVFVVLDNFSRYVRLYAIKKATAVTVTNRMINDYIATYGSPRCVVSDHGAQFTSKVWQNRLRERGIPPTLTSVYHPQSNPAERVMRELGRMFRTYCHQDHAEWPRHLGYIEWVLNNTVHEATGCTPQELFLTLERYNPFSAVVSFPLRVALSQKTKMILAREVQLSHAERRRLRHDQQGRVTKFVIGDRVLVRTHRLSSAIDKQIHKFFLLYQGPYVIVRVSSQTAYTVAEAETNRIIGTYNIIHLRRYITPGPSPLQPAEVKEIPQRKLSS